MPLPDVIPFIGLGWSDVLFLLLSGVVLAAAFAVVFGRDIIKSGLFLILTLGALAGIDLQEAEGAQAAAGAAQLAMDKATADMAKGIGRSITKGFEASALYNLKETPEEMKEQLSSLKTEQQQYADFLESMKQMDPREQQLLRPTRPTFDLGSSDYFSSLIPPVNG